MTNSPLKVSAQPLLSTDLEASTAEFTVHQSYQFCETGDFHLLHRLAAMLFDRLDADAQLNADGLIRLAVVDKVDDLSFTR